VAIIFRLLRYPRARALAAWMSELVPSSKPLLMRLAWPQIVVAHPTTIGYATSPRGPAIHGRLAKHGILASRKSCSPDHKSKECFGGCDGASNRDARDGPKSGARRPDSACRARPGNARGSPAAPE